MNLKIRTVDFLVYSFWIIFFVAVLLKYPYAGADPFVVITFFIIGIVAFIMSIREQRNVSIKRNYYIFCLIFFFFAPLQQYLSKTRLWSGNGMSVVYTDDDYLIVNLLILISMVLFEIGYAFGLRIKRREKVKQMIEEEKVDKYVERNYKASTFLLLTIPAKCFVTLEEKKFEGVSFLTPGDSDLYLRSVYGDYMQLPPVEERENRHQIIQVKL